MTIRMVDWLGFPFSFRVKLRLKIKGNSDLGRGLFPFANWSTYFQFSQAYLLLSVHSLDSKQKHFI